jgi:hypothetical protein
MIMLSDEDLVRLWHSGEAAAKIVERLDGGMTPKQLMAQWARLKASGQLPPIQRPLAGRYPRGEGNNNDGRPGVGALTANYEYDPLLERLNEVYELHDDGTVTVR